MAGTKGGVSVTLREDIQLVCRYPNRFRAVLTQGDASGNSQKSGGSQKKLVVVSNGTLVWMYRPGLAEYSVTSFAAWKQADNDIPTLGLVIGGFYLGAGRPLVPGVSQHHPGKQHPGADCSPADASFFVPKGQVRRRAG